MNDSALFGEHPDATSILTVPCAICGERADLLEADHGWLLGGDAHEACMSRDPAEPLDPDWEWDDRSIR